MTVQEPSEGAAAGGAERQCKRRSRYRSFLWAATAFCALLALVCFVLWRSDLSEIRERVGEAVDPAAAPSVRMQQSLAFLRDRVGYGRHDDYFLVPFLRFLKPTALQVLEHGGDCAYRGRALVVILGQLDVEAGKLALYDASGEAVHAVVRVHTEKGPYLIDPLFNIIHQDERGDPIPLARLEHDPAVLATSVARAAAGGNPRAARYPLDRYGFGDVRTINWNKSGLMRFLYGFVSGLIGKEQADTLPRPYMSEEPALMTMAFAGAGAATSLALLGISSLLRRRRRRRDYEGGS